jgi:hypothetical protein
MKFGQGYEIKIKFYEDVHLEKKILFNFKFL